MRALSGIALVAALVLAGVRVAADVTKDDLPRILKDLKGSNAKARAQAATDAGHLGAVRASDAKDTVPLLLELAKKDSVADVRRAAAEALGNMGADAVKAVPVLIDRLKNDKEMRVKVAAAKSLAQFGPDAKEAMPALREAAKQTEEKKNRPLMQAARAAMKSIQSK
jgi:HEAT repeat protein